MEENLQQISSPGIDSFGYVKTSCSRGEKKNTDWETVMDINACAADWQDVNLTLNTFNMQCSWIRQYLSRPGVGH